MDRSSIEHDYDQQYIQKFHADGLRKWIYRCIIRIDGLLKLKRVNFYQQDSSNIPHQRNLSNIDGKCR